MVAIFLPLSTIQKKFSKILQSFNNFSLIHKTAKVYDCFITCPYFSALLILILEFCAPWNVARCKESQHSITQPSLSLSSAVARRWRRLKFTVDTWCSVTVFLRIFAFPFMWPGVLRRRHVCKVSLRPYTCLQSL